MARHSEGPLRAGADTVGVQAAGVPLQLCQRLSHDALMLPQQLPRLGIGVAVSGDTAVVGAYVEDAGGSTAGAAYVFQRDEGVAGNWGQVKKLTASDAQAPSGRR